MYSLSIIHKVIIRLLLGKKDYEAYVKNCQEIVRLDKEIARMEEDEFINARSW